MKDSLKSILFMFIATVFFTSLAGAVKYFNQGRIKANQEARLKGVVLKALGFATPVGAGADAVSRGFARKVRVVRAGSCLVYVGRGPKGRVKGFAFTAKGPGFWGPVEAMVGLDPSGGRIIGLVFYKQTETPGLGGRISEARFQGQFKGLNLAQHAAPGLFFRLPRSGEAKGTNDLDAISGATQTSMAVQGFLNKELKRFLTTCWPDPALQPFRKP